MDAYNFCDKVKNGAAYSKIQILMYGLPQAGVLKTRNYNK